MNSRQEVAAAERNPKTHKNPYHPSARPNRQIHSKHTKHIAHTHMLLTRATTAATSRIGTRSFASRVLERAATAMTTTTANATTTTTTTTTTTSRRIPQFQQQQQQRRCAHSSSSIIEERLREKGIVLPKPAGPRANYDVICHDEDANVMYVSGHLPFKTDGTLMTGTLTGDEGKDVEYGYEAARNAALNIVATLKDRLGGDLDRIEKIQKVFGIVQSTTDFQHQHLVMDGASDLFMEVFGEKVGYHARSAIGTSTLPLDITVEVEAIVKLRPALRFSVGQKVSCRVGPDPVADWADGTITRLRYTEPGWGERSAPYQILLDDGRYIFAPEDTEAVIKAAAADPPHHG